MNQTDGSTPSPTDPLSRGKLGLLAALSSLSLFAALPPFQLWPLAWVSPLFWLILVRHRDWQPAPPVEYDKTTSRRRARLKAPFRLAWHVLRGPYGIIWLTSFVHWLCLVYGLRLAHWANNISWVALSMYLACYAPLFVGLTRVAVHRLAVPLVLAAPLVWTGFELIRAYLFSGFSGALLGHTQVGWVAMIQIADSFGAYGVSFVVMMFAAGLSQSMPHGSSPRWRPLPLTLATLVVAANLVYGHARLRENEAAVVPIDLSKPKPAGAVRIALVQSSFNTVFEYNPARSVKIFQTYLGQSQVASRRWPELDLIVWPEGTFEGEVTEKIIEGTLQAKADEELSALRENVAKWQALFRKKLKFVADAVNQRRDGTRGNTSLLVGTGTLIRTGTTDKAYNTALHIGPQGEIKGRYHKTHLVPFGEYLPFTKHFPWLYDVTPMDDGLSAGDKTILMKIGEIRTTPSICFESMAPRVIRRQVLELHDRGESPQVLISITNDGWFWGTGVLDIHFHCAVFRALENRRPLLIAANTGITAWVDPYGRLIAKAPRGEKHIIMAEIHPPARDRVTLHMRIGDWPARLCAAFCGLLALIGLRRPT